MGTIILTVEGKPEVCDFDKSYYSDDHDVPALWIGDQIIDLGDGHHNWPLGKDKDHMRWKLDPNKTYRVTIEEMHSDGGDQRQ